MRRRAARGSWALLVLVPGLVAVAATASASTAAPGRWGTPLGTEARYAHTWLSGVPVAAVPVRAAAGLPAPPGTLRRAELSGRPPVRHVLAVTLPAADLQGPLRVGTLLALTPDLTPAGLGVRTSTGRRLFAALRDYGAYVVGPSPGAAAGLRVDPSLARSFAAGSRLASDLAVLVGALDRVTNSGPGAIGGPGPRRVAANADPLAVTSPPPPSAAARSRAAAPLAVAAPSVPSPSPSTASPGDAPVAVLWGLGGLAAALLAIGLRAGVRLAR